MKVRLVDQDCAGGAWWSILELGNGNVEVQIYENTDGSRWEALEAAFNRYPDMPIVDNFFTGSDNEVEIIVLGEFHDA